MKKFPKPFKTFLKPTSLCRPIKSSWRCQNLLSKRFRPGSKGRALEIKKHLHPVVTGRRCAVPPVFIDSLPMHFVAVTGRPVALYCEGKTRFKNTAPGLLHDCCLGCFQPMASISVKQGESLLLPFIAFVFSNYNIQFDSCQHFRINLEGIFLRFRNKL